jgi:pimeloyl-ACP methyl ester carboxylesterase
MTAAHATIGEGPPVILLGDRPQMWNELLPLLEPWMRAIVPADPETAQDLVGELGLEDFAVVGQGEAGVHAQRLAAAGSVKTMILLGTPEAPGVDLHELDIPTFLLWGEDDDVVPIAVAERMSDALDFSTLALIPECGHDPLADDGPTAIPLIYEFLRMRFLGKSHGHAEEIGEGGAVPVQILTHRPDPSQL